MGDSESPMFQMVGSYPFWEIPVYKITTKMSLFTNNIALITFYLSHNFTTPLQIKIFKILPLTWKCCQIVDWWILFLLWFVKFIMKSAGDADASGSSV